jgi:hypothetical protein
MILEIEINPKIPILTQENLEKYATLSITGTGLQHQIKKVIENQIVQLTCDYNQSINGMKGII